MKRTLYFFTILIVISFSNFTFAHNCGNSFKFNAIDWLSDQKDISEFHSNFEELEEVELNQVLLTRFCPAVQELEKEKLVLLEPRFISYYLGEKYKPINGKNAYLIRGVINNFTGNPQALLNRKKNTIEISFTSLGQKNKTFEFFPVILFLQKKPSRVLITTSGAL